MTERDQFGPALRRERERCGISLQDIADKTKIAASLFAGLERNDVSRWPSGIYRRSFLRAYAEAVGLDGERLIEQFDRLFPPEDDQRRPAGPTCEGPRPARAPRRLLRPMASLAIDVALVAAVGAIFLLAYGWPAVWPALAGSSAVVLLATPVVIRKTPGTWLLARRVAAGGQPAPDDRSVAGERSDERHRTIGHRAAEPSRHGNTVQARGTRHGKKSASAASAAQERHPGTRVERRRGKRAARRAAK